MKGAEKYDMYKRCMRSGTISVWIFFGWKITTNDLRGQARRQAEARSMSVEQNYHGCANTRRVKPRSKKAVVVHSFVVPCKCTVRCMIQAR